MAEKLPTTPEDFTAIQGIGPIRCAKFSQYFLPAIARFIEDPASADVDEASPKKKSGSDTPATSTKTQLNQMQTKTKKKENDLLKCSCSQEGRRGITHPKEEANQNHKGSSGNPRTR